MNIAENRQNWEKVQEEEDNKARLRISQFTRDQKAKWWKTTTYKLLGPLGEACGQKSVEITNSLDTLMWEVDLAYIYSSFSWYSFKQW